MIEGYNLLSNKFRVYFTSVNLEMLEEGNVSETSEPAHYIYHYIPLDESVVSRVPTDLVVNITNLDGTVTRHTATMSLGIDGDATVYQEDGFNTDNKKMQVYCYRNVARIHYAVKKVSDDGAETQFMAFATKEALLHNDVEIIAPCANTKANYEKVLNMTFSDWFGGSSEGVYGGIHLFLGGNTKDEEKALVCWSDLNRPLYFSEGCYAYVGDKAQKVTAFGKQGQSLIILKERETYATQYSSSDSVISADSAMAQSVIDVTVSEVTFPMVQVHGFIGCDCPKTVQLCRNRLVWAHSDGKIYTLVSANQWNERSIFEVSAMVEKRLTEYTADKLKNASSADWEGHYILSVGDKLYLMEYNSYGYANVASYSKDDDAQLRIPWWVWDTPTYNYNFVEGEDFGSEEKPLEITAMVTSGRQLYVWTQIMAGRQGYEETFIIPEVMCFEGQKDRVPEIKLPYQQSATIDSQFTRRGFIEKNIVATAQTKLFDFGSPSVKKSVPKAEITFGANDGNVIRISTITDAGRSAKEKTMKGTVTEEIQPYSFERVVVRNPYKQSFRIGYRFESDGGLLLDAISIYYKQLEGAK